MTFDELKEKALSLPYTPGVYIMRDQTDKVIYVGKAKKLKNRVSQYFQDTASHTPKTRIMVSKIHHFDVIVAASEFEALVLECSLIKRYMPKYNILLKDDKGYPYLRLDMREIYPRITLVSRLSDDGAEYFGPGKASRCSGSRNPFWNQPGDTSILRQSGCQSASAEKDIPFQRQQSLPGGIPAVVSKSLCYCNGGTHDRRKALRQGVLLWGENT